MATVKAPTIVITMPIGPVMNRIANPKPLVASAATLVTTDHALVARVVIFACIACLFIPNVANAPCAPNNSLHL